MIPIRPRTMFSDAPRQRRDTPTRLSYKRQEARVPRIIHITDAGKLEMGMAPTCGGFGETLASYHIGGTALSIMDAWTQHKVRYEGDLNLTHEICEASTACFIMQAPCMERDAWFQKGGRDGMRSQDPPMCLRR
eukprot:1247899-Pyramimonas_sp.AAC.1